jgi:hypothetical protein
MFPAAQESAIDLVVPGGSSADRSWTGVGPIPFPLQASAYRSHGRKPPRGGGAVSLAPEAAGRASSSSPTRPRQVAENAAVWVDARDIGTPCTRPASGSPAGRPATDCSSPGHRRPPTSSRCASTVASPTLGEHGSAQHGMNRPIRMSANHHGPRRRAVTGGAGTWCATPPGGRRLTRGHRSSARRCTARCDMGCGARAAPWRWQLTACAPRCRSGSAAMSTAPIGDATPAEV